VAIETLTTKTGIKRLGKFGIVGIFNTLIDFVIYNLLSGVIGLNLIESNIISTTVAMFVAICHSMGINGHDEFLIKNAAKAAGTVLSLAWNFIMYKKVIFK
jgi:putative flippase GtrA